MKIGCTSWSFNWDSPYESAIESIGKLKFRGTELIATREKDLTEYYTRERISKLSELCGFYNLAISEFALAGDFWWKGGLSSFNRDDKMRAIGQFKRGVQIAKELGTNIICFVSHWPIGIQTPIPYPPSYLYPSRDGYPQSSHSPKLTIRLSEDFSWERTWENYVESIGMCADIAGEGGILLAVEGHLHVIAGTTDSLLRLFDAVKSNSLGMNYDTGWQFLQREYIPISVHKLGKRLFHVHIRDGDGILHYNLPPGQGIIDWDEVVESLKHIGYGGFLSFELGYDENERWLSEGKEYLERILRNHKALD